MERLITQDLLKWSKSDTKEPLFILGARQIGKTYSVIEFAKDYYNGKYIYLNFLDTSIDYKMLKNTTNPTEIINAIEILKKVKIDNSWLIIFDEICLLYRFIETVSLYKTRMTLLKLWVIFLVSKNECLI